MWLCCSGFTLLNEKGKVTLKLSDVLGYLRRVDMLCHWLVKSIQLSVVIWLLGSELFTSGATEQVPYTLHFVTYALHCLP